ncbi:MAG: hypothetical protein ACREBG_22755 [Pyrinomonadaceae bacterium]
MGVNDLITQISDPYERKARLWPALLVIFPPIVTLELLYGSRISTWTNVVMLAASCGGFYLLASVCRERGKRLEPKLYEAWGGKPTTQLLRHRNPFMDRVTKQRYHGVLEAKIKKQFPDQDQETSEPGNADEIYQSAVSWLLRHTRDTTQSEFRLLFRENISYGFRRNALGLKPFGLTICSCTILWILVAYGVVNGSASHLLSPGALVKFPVTGVVSVGVSLFMLTMWMTFFTKASVRTAAFTYADTLLRCCEVFDQG